MKFCHRLTNCNERSRMEIQVSGHYLHMHIIHNGHVVVFHLHQDGYLHHIQEDGRHPSMANQKNCMHNAAQMDVRKMVPLYGCLNGCLNDVRYGIDFSDTHTCVFFSFSTASDLRRSLSKPQFDLSNASNVLCRLKSVTLTTRNLRWSEIRHLRFACASHFTSLEPLLALQVFR